MNFAGQKRSPQGPLTRPPYFELMMSSSMLRRQEELEHATFNAQNPGRTNQRTATGDRITRRKWLISGKWEFHNKIPPSLNK